MTIDLVTIRNPQGLSEFYEYIQTDNKSLKGNFQRNRLNRKKVTQLTWTMLTPAQLQALQAWTEDANTHAYSNNQSRRSGGLWAFTGIVTITEEGSQIRGGSYLTDTYSVTIREV